MLLNSFYIVGTKRDYIEFVRLINSWKMLERSPLFVDRIYARTSRIMSRRETFQASWDIVARDFQLLACRQVFLPDSSYKTAADINLPTVTGGGTDAHRSLRVAT